MNPSRFSTGIEKVNSKWEQCYLMKRETETEWQWMEMEWNGMEWGIEGMIGSGRHGHKPTNTG